MRHAGIDACGDPTKIVSIQQESSRQQNPTGFNYPILPPDLRKQEAEAFALSHQTFLQNATTFERQNPLRPA